MPRPRKEFELNEEIAKRYYTAKEAQKELGLTNDRDRFNYIMRTRNIQRVPFLGGVGYYKKTEIDHLAAEIYSFLLAGESSNFQYRAATVDDIDAENHLAYLNFGERALNPKTMEARKNLARINPESTYHLYDHSFLVASINIVPLKREAILHFKDGKRGWLFEEEDMERLESGKPLECIIIDVMSTPIVPPEKRSVYGTILLRNFFGPTWKQWGERGVEIARFYSNGGTEAGHRLLKSAGGHPINQSEHELNPRVKRVIYEVEVAESDKKLFRPHKQALVEWRKSQG